MDVLDLPLLLADIGGTNARFCLASQQSIGPSVVLPVRDYDGPEAALRAFLKEAPTGGRPRRGALAVAGPVSGGTASLTNGTWQFDAAQLSETFDLEQLDLVNDFEAIAWAVPKLRKTDLYPLGGGQTAPAGPVAVIGPGTGLGVAAYLPAEASRSERVVAGEGGHATMAAGSEREDRILEHLRRRFGHVSAERLLSGDGLVNLYETVAAVDGLSAPRRTPAEIVSYASDKGRSSRVALELFCALLGSFAGDVALTFGARGGVYLAGGILPRMPERLEASDFRKRFEAKGRLQPYLEAIPTALIQRSDPAFLGLWHLACRG